MQSNVLFLQTPGPSDVPRPISTLANRAVSGGRFHGSPAILEEPSTDPDYMEEEGEQEENEEGEEDADYDNPPPWLEEEPVPLPPQPSNGFISSDDGAGPNETDIRQELLDAGIQNITYTLLKPGKVYEYGFSIPVLLIWDAFIKMLLNKFGIERSAQDGAEFQFALNKSPNQWIVIKSESGWISSVLDAVLSNVHDRSDHHLMGVRGRKREIKDAMPLVVRVVRRSYFHQFLL
jgi:hypothetical protein